MADKVAVEKVRLLVWDLDETFWAGTLTEGGMQYLRAHHDIVVELARRGIVSSICSKNDFDRVRDILQAEGIWDYFIFPSINWEPKGPRLAALVEAVQLRAPTVLFIDDNHANLREAEFFVPEMQVSDQTIIASLLADPRCKGKDDSALTRLAQYKLLEKRKEDEAAAAGSGGSNVDFLRSSDIRVQIDHDIEANLDRAVELINRTNQLNYTKKRLPDDAELARAELRRQLRLHYVQAGLIRVADRYGDHGYCGYYQINTSAAGAVLMQFCFSCRILNMGVETWLYQRLGRPELAVVGDVLTPIDRDAAPVDWIRVGAPGARDATASTPAISRLFARGGCDLAAVTHYFGAHAGEVVGEFNFARNNVDIRVDHSQFLHYALSGMTPSQSDALRRLGYRPEDATTRMLDSQAADQVWLFSFWNDAGNYLYRHRASDLALPLTAPFPTPYAGRGDKTKLDESAVPERFRDHWIARALDELRAGFDFIGQISEGMFKTTLADVLSRAPAGTIGFVVLANEIKTNLDGGSFRLAPTAALNAWTREVLAGFPAFEGVDIRQFVRAPEELDAKNSNHFDRRVYFRLFEHLMQRIAARRGAAVAGTPLAAE